MAETWRSAFLTQAISDYKTFKVLSEAGLEVPQCQRLHYLQMCTEKLAKGLMTDPMSSSRPITTHSAFRRYVQVAFRNPRLQSLCDVKPGAWMEAYRRSLAEQAELVEKLAPSGGEDKPNPEYPWEKDGTIYVPADYSFRALNSATPRMIKLLQFIAASFKLAEEELAG